MSLETLAENTISSNHIVVAFYGSNKTER